MKTGRYTEEFGSLVRKIKDNRTFAKFSADTGLSVATLSKYVSGNGRGNIKLQTLQAVSYNGLPIQIVAETEL